MNQIIQRLSEVETAASSIIEEAGAKKKQMAKDQDARIAAFEKQVHEETQKKISAQQAELEKQIAEELEAQKEELEKQLAHMDRIMRKAIRRSPDSCWQRLWRNNFYGIISVVPKKSYEKG